MQKRFGNRCLVCGKLLTQLSQLETRMCGEECAQRKREDSALRALRMKRYEPRARRAAVITVKAAQPCEPTKAALRKKRRRLRGLSKRQLLRDLEAAKEKIERLKVVTRSLPKIHPFYSSQEWKELRYFVLRVYGRVCMACGTTAGAMNVDHIMPISRAVERKLDPRNLQILCPPCNAGKSNRDATDYRAPAQLAALETALLSRPRLRVETSFPFAGRVRNEEAGKVQDS